MLLDRSSTIASRRRLLSGDRRGGTPKPQCRESTRGAAGVSGRLRARTLLIGLAVALVLTAVLPLMRGLLNAEASASGAHSVDAVHGSGASSTTKRTTASPKPPAPKSGHAPVLGTGPVTIDMPYYYSWALLDRHSGQVSGSPNHISSTSSTESMVKTWIAADFLRTAGAAPEPDRLAELSTMIRDSDDWAAEDIYQLDGGDDVIVRMILTCELADTILMEGWWSNTEISARDSVRLGECIADGRAAGPQWTPWLLNEMREVRGEGRFGFIEVLPAATAAETAIKNGWTEWPDDGDWHISCLAIHSDWVLAALTVYPLELGLDFGAEVCRSIAQQLMAGH